MHIVAERPEHQAAIANLLDISFGPTRESKTVYRLRAGVAPDPDLCHVALENGALRGSLPFWPILAAGMPALLLGPLAVAPEHRGRGFGVALIRHGLARAEALDHRIVLLVGDPEYYERFGFRRALTEGLSLPGPVEERRFLGLELVPSALAELEGAVSSIAANDGAAAPNVPILSVGG
jgi:predicted N-acetyltransferase YhbS